MDLGWTWLRKILGTNPCGYVAFDVLIDEI